MNCFTIAVQSVSNTYDYAIMMALQNGLQNYKFLKDLVRYPFATLVKTMDKRRCGWKKSRGSKHNRKHCNLAWE